LDRITTERRKTKVTLWKRGNVWWSIYFVDGIRRQESTGTSNKRLAREIEKKRRDEMAARKFRVPEIEADEELTFAGLAARFLSRAEVRPHHIDRLKHLLPYFAEIPVLRFNRGMAADYRIRRHKEKTVSDATINRDLSVLRHILYWAVDQGILAANPMTRLRLARERRVRRPVMTVREELLLLSAAAPHLKRIIIAALDTGMRRGEILHQLWEHVDLERLVLSVSRSKTPEGEAREIPLTKRLADLLTSDQRITGEVFTYKDQPIITSIKTAWRCALKNSGLRRFRFHDLRHTYNTRLMEASVLQEVRMALMGHQNRDKVHATYTHVELPLKRAAIAKLEAWVQTQIQTSGGNHDDRQSERSVASEGGTSRNLEPGAVAEALEEENAGADSAGSGRQTAGRDPAG
jgi:integrase